MILLTPDRLLEADPASIAAARECVVACCDVDVRGRAAAALLFSDYAVLARTVSFTIDEALAWAGSIWRIRHRALHLLTRPCLTAVEALESGLIDHVTDDIDAWQQSFFRNRSATAMDSAAMLITRRGGDVLERMEFARLFATGEPQRGLKKFLERRADARRPR